MTIKKLHKLFDKYAAVWETNATNQSTFTTNLLVRSVAITFRVWLFTQLYSTTFRFAQTQSINGVTVPIIIWTLALTQSFSNAARPPIARLIEEEVRTGTIAYQLSRPFSYSLFHYFGFLGRGIVPMISNTVVSLLAALVLVGPIPLSPITIIIGLGLFLMGFTIDFFAQFMIGILAFKFEDISAFMWIYSKGQLVFGGFILPLSLFPDNLRKIAEVLPFSLQYYASADIITNYTSASLGRYFSILLLWVIVFGVMQTILIRILRNHVAQNGG